MLIFRNVSTIDGKTTDYTVVQAEDTDQTIEIDASGLTLLPALIDPHVHLRTPGAEHKENWESGARAALAGGITTVFDMPNNTPACITKECMIEKRALIDSQLQRTGIPLRYGVYLGADKHNLHEIAQIQPLAAALKIFMGSTTGNLVMDDPQALDNAFKLAAEHDLLVAVHAEDEHILQSRYQQFFHLNYPAAHSEIRDRQAAVVATEQALELCAKYRTRLYLLHVSTKEEVELIRRAKKAGLPIFAETTPHHLFLSIEDYAQWGTLVQMNPPLRTREDQAALWEAIRDNTFDTIGSDHAPHTLEEKAKGFGKAPSGTPGLETTLPLLLNAYHDGRLSLERIVSLTRTNAEKAFRLPSHDDVVLVDLQRTRTVDNARLQTRCGWSPFAERTLKGWPVYTVVQGHVFRVDEGIKKLQKGI
jgi:dihydroorotase